MLNKIFPALVVVVGAGIGVQSDAAVMNEAVLVPQDPGAQAPELASNAGVGASLNTPDVMTALTNKVNGRGWTLGYDEKRDRYVVIGIGMVNAPIGSATYLDSRRLGWMYAMQDARKQFVQFMAARVSTDVQTLYTEPNIQEEINTQAAAVEAAANPSATDKVAMLIHSNLDAQLREEGVDIDTNAGRGHAKEKAKQLMMSDSIMAAVQVAATSEAAGLQVVETYENTRAGTGTKTEIGIIAIYSAKSAQMSATLLGKGQPPTGKAKTTIKQWVDSLSVDQLLYTQGIQQRTDENGNVCLISFAQAAPRSSSQRTVNAARGKAYANGMQDFRDFAGTKVVSNLDNAQAETIQEYSDQSEKYMNESSYREQVSSVGKSLALPGVTVVRNWQVFHPLEKAKPVVGQVLVWNTRSSEAAQALKKVLEANGGSFGGAGYKAPPGSEGGAGAASGTPTAGDDGSGVSGDDDDI